MEAKEVTAYTELRNAVINAVGIYGKGRVKDVIMKACGVARLGDIPNDKYRNVMEALNAMRIYWQNIDRYTDRLWAPGGWIVRSTFTNATHQIFIEDPEHLWELQ